MHKGIIYCSFRIRKDNKRNISLSLLLHRLCAESRLGGNILAPLCIRTANERDKIVFLSGFVHFFLCGRIMLLFLLCGNVGKHTGNADDIGYEDGVCIGRIGGTSVLI